MNRAVGRLGWGDDGSGGGGISPTQAQAAISVARTTDFNLDGTEQFPTFDTIIKGDITGNFFFTAGTDTITITKSGSYAFHVYCTTRNESAFEFKITMFNNGVEIPNIAARTEEGTDQAGVDEYQACISIEAIDLTAGTLQIMVQEVSRTGSGTNQVVPGFVWSVRQNSGVAGAPGADAAGGFTRDAFLAFRASDSGSFNASGASKNAFKNNAQTASNMSVLFDESGVVDTTNAKIVLTEGTWEISYLVKAVNVTSGAFIHGTIKEDPDGTPSDYAAGTQTESGGTSSVNSSTVTVLIKSDGTREITGFVFSNDTDIDIFGAGGGVLRTYISGHRINTIGT